MKRSYLVGVLIAVLFTSGAMGYIWLAGRSSKSETPETSAQPASVDGISSAMDGSAFLIPYEPVDLHPSVEPYTVKPDLSNVENLEDFRGIPPELRSLLAKNAFFATPTDEQQLFFVYEKNDYENIPSFITTDSVLQVYHIFYDFTLRTVEKEKLYGILDKLTSAMVAESRRVSGRLTAPEWKNAAASNEAYFSVAAGLMGPHVPSKEVKPKVEAELKLIRAHSQRNRSAIFPYQLDYTQFIPRGHYTRSETLKKFFNTMMWYGYAPFPVEKEREIPDLERIRQSVLMTIMLYRANVDGRPAIESWERIYEPTVFYVGAADDLTPSQYKKVIDQVYGPDPGYQQLQDENKLQEVYRELKKLPEPRIQTELIGIPGGQQFRFMGQRYIPDSRILQELSTWPERSFPKGLDVMAVFGSDRAADILDNVYKEPARWEHYLSRREAMIQEFSALPPDTWRSNLYWAWLWSLDSLIHPYGEGYPSFMRNQAWLDKCLYTSLGSWAELRHDTILYGKQSGAECGGDGEERRIPKSYVEPNVEFYNRLLWLTKASRAGLQARGVITDTIAGKFSEFEDLLSFLKEISIKELTNQKITDDEHRQMLIYGANLENLTLSVMEGTPTHWYEITSEADKDMAVIADVHTSSDSALEEGVGHAYEIYVVVPIEGKLWLTRGAMFSYYEFIHPASDRLTDEKWQQMLKSGRTPEPPVWIKSFSPGTRYNKPAPKKVYSSGC